MKFIYLFYSFNIIYRFPKDKKDPSLVLVQHINHKTLHFFNCLIFKVDPPDSCLIIQSPHLRVSAADVRASEVVVSQSWSVVRMACGQLLLLLLGVTSARGSEEAMTELKRNIFYHYDTNVIPQEVSSE